MEHIEIRGARTHNLKNIDLDIPRNKFVVVTGVSGSGKSSLVFDTIYTEAQRQLIETFSTFARRRLPKLTRPDVDEIKNLGTGIVIDQKRLGKTLRSTVGTATEIYTYLRLLFSRAAEPFVGFSHVYSFNHPEGMCPSCKGLGKRIQLDREAMYDPELSLREGAILHPDYKVGGYYWRTFVSVGLFNPDKKLKDFAPEELERLFDAEDVEYHYDHSGVEVKKKWTGLIQRLESYYVQKAEDELPKARRDAYQKFLVYQECNSCQGTRLNDTVLSAQLNGRNIAELSGMELTDLDDFFAGLTANSIQVMVQKIRSVLQHLIGIGVGYLTLNRAVATLSGGESQRVKMARQLDCDLTGLMYVLDEPSIGLHPRDTDRLLDIIHDLRDRGNSVLVVEHDPQIIEAADWIVDIGPKAGRHGGQLCFEGIGSMLRSADSPTGLALQRKTSTKKNARRLPQGWMEIRNATANNLKNISVNIPTGILCCITGVAGSGKSSLVHSELVGRFPAVVIDQSAPGKSSRSNPLTYTGIFDRVRKDFAKAAGTRPALFSFNSEGACPACKGQGYQKVDMNFLDDITILCPECEGKRYKPEVLEHLWQGKTIFDILEMSVADGLDFFTDRKTLSQLSLLNRVGLGYLSLGQSLSTLSGGEAQRLKLAAELDHAGNLYILDEPTTGLHMSDVRRLMVIIDELVEAGNSVLIIEHNLDVIQQADWIIDLGPEGGRGGGEVLAEGAPEQVCQIDGSITGRYLKEAMNYP
ncbi:MAG: excinuclease ABC subunit UvrA [Candidatus Marinimicrobia bacterium]|nr:excinuclease ABC subunit UvrA [Candidatus Neomarinimicrobiota bacterium]